MSKRGQNEGSVYKLANGTWRGSVSLGRGPDGKRDRKYFSGKTRREVAEKLKVAQRDHQLGLPVAPERQTVAYFMNTWLEERAKPSTRITTYTTYESHTRIHILPSLGHIILQQLTPQQVQAFVNYKAASPDLAIRTVIDIHSVLRRALNQAVRWGLVPRNVAALAELPRLEKKEQRYLTPDQARMLLEAARGDRLEALYSVAIALGLRRGEALGLRWEDVDLDRGVLQVKVALHRIGGKLQLAEPKTPGSRRSINLPRISIAALRAHKVRQLEERLKAGDKWKESGHVFTSTIGTPMEPSNFRRAFQKLLARAGIEHMRIHDMRHTAASLMIAQKIEPKMISEILGHSRTGITMDLYGHLFEPMRREAADRMDDILGDQKGSS